MIDKTNPPERCPLCGSRDDIVLWNGEGPEQWLCYGCAMDRIDDA